mgnify:CR=1 FL=1
MKESVKKLAVYIPLTLCVLALGISLTAFMFRNRWHRVVMYFPQYGAEGIYAEPRLVPASDSVGEALEVFTGELLLGPETNRYQRLFNKETTVEFCIVKDGTAFVGLSKKALFFSGETADSKTGISMLKRNIVKNFTSIDNVEVYIDSIGVMQTDF